MRSKNNQTSGSKHMSNKTQHVNKLGMCTQDLRTIFFYKLHVCNIQLSSRNRLTQIRIACAVQDLEARGPGSFLRRRVRPNWIELYRKFLGSPTFAYWFERRTAAAERSQLSAWRRARAVTDISEFLPQMSEVRCVHSHPILVHLPCVAYGICRDWNRK